MRTFRRAGEPCSVLVGSGSQLAQALSVSAAAARNVYDETTQRFISLYGAEDAEWFMHWEPPKPYLTGYTDELLKCQASTFDCAHECRLRCMCDARSSQLKGETNAC